MKNIYYKTFNPFGVEKFTIFLFPQFHWGLFMFNPFGIITNLFNNNDKIAILLLQNVNKYTKNKQQ